MGRRVLLGLVCLGAAVAALAVPGEAARSRRIAANRRTANAVARRLLGDVVLPSGARRLKQEPRARRSSLGAAFEGAIFAAEVDRHAFWKVSASPAAVVESFESHPPAGGKLLNSTYSSGSAAAAYELGAQRRGVIGPRQLMVSAVVLPDGMTGVRADAVVRYFSPRPRSERVPAAARLVQVTKGNPGESPTVSRVVTRPVLVRTLGRFVDSLPFEGRLTGSYACGVFTGPVVTLVFRARPHGPELAQVREPAETPVYASPCATTALTIEGKHLPPLLEGGILLKRASKLLGVRLTG